MLATVFTKTTRDRWVGTAIASGLIGLWLLMAMAVYRDIDLGIYTNLPDAIRSVMGIPEGADVASLGYSVMFSFAAALTLAGLAVSMGTGTIAGEESRGTLGLLLGNPKSRTHVLVSKLASMVVLIAAGALLVWGAGRLAPMMLDIDIGSSQVGAVAVHLAVNALFYGFLAAAIGGWTGNPTMSSALAAGIMIFSYFAVGLLPLVPDLADLARIFPWYYFDASQPLINGIDWGHLAVLLTGIAAFFTLALVGVNRRDLKELAERRSIIDRLRANPLTSKVVDRLAGSARVSAIWVKTVSDHQGLLIVVAYTMFLMMGVLMGPMYSAIDETLAGFADGFPDVLLAIAGSGDITTPEGWYQLETFGLMAPISVMVLTVLIGARALAGEEADHTMDLLLASPIPRSRIVIEKATAMTIHATLVGLATFAGVSVGSLIAGLGMNYANIAAASLMSVLLGLVFGAVALAVSAATGRSRAAVYTAIGIALTSHLANALFPLADSTEGLARWFPHHYYLTGEPLTRGLDASDAGLLALMVIVLVAAAMPLFQRRDVRG